LRETQEGGREGRGSCALVEMAGAGCGRGGLSVSVWEALLVIEGRREVERDLQRSAQPRLRRR